MVGTDSGQDATGTPDPVEKGLATLNTLKYDMDRFRIVLRQLRMSHFADRVL